MRLCFRLACIAYCIFLTILLLAPDPAWICGLSKRPEFPWGSFGVHAIAFAGLSFLALGIWWPHGISRPLVAALLVYGTATELLQYFVPSRHVRWIDWIQNMGGVAVGAAAYWIVWQTLRPRTNPDSKATMEPMAEQVGAR